MGRVCWQCGTPFRTEKITHGVVDDDGVTRVYDNVLYSKCPRCGYSFYNFSRAKLVQEIQPKDRGIPPVHEEQPRSQGDGAARGDGAPVSDGAAAGGQGTGKTAAQQHAAQEAES